MTNDGEIISLIQSRLEPESRAPRFERVETAIESAIRGGELAAGAVLPREPDLAAGLGLSRQTVGRALNNLAERGLVVRRRGVGTFISPRRMEQPLNQLYSFVRTLSSDGQPPVSQLLGVRIMLDAAASPLLTGSESGLVMEIGRLFFLDAVPAVFETVYLPVAAGQRLPLDRLAGAVIDELLRETSGIEIDRGEEVLSLTMLARPAADLLGVKTCSPAFSIERISFAAGEPVQMRRSLIRGDRARFRVRLLGSNLEGSRAEVAERIETTSDAG